VRRSTRVRALEVTEKEAVDLGDDGARIEAGGRRARRRGATGAGSDHQAVRQRLDDLHGQRRREPRLGQRAAMPAEQVLHRAHCGRLDVREPPPQAARERCFLEEDAMQGRVARVHRDHRLDVERDRRRQVEVARPRGAVAQGRLHLVEVLVDQGDEDRVLVREVLVERADRDAGALGDAVGGAGAVPVAGENLSCSAQDRGDRLPRSPLPRRLSRREPRSRCPRHAPPNPSSEPEQSFSIQGAASIADRPMQRASGRTRAVRRRRGGSMASLAVAGWVAFFGAAFVWRTLRQIRTTGSSGFRGLTGRPGSLAWWGGVLLVAGFAIAVAGAALAWREAIAPIEVLDRPLVHALGALLYSAGFGLTLWAQVEMGASWRIGVDESERTTLVAGGAFRCVRNPIFSGMWLVAAGLSVLAPNLASLAGTALVAVALEIHVRAVEEPYLARVHGAAYAAYRARTGRFVPLLGR
jgi:protein-S-isoprenylcysteine O-methyltransferase Ste14